MSAEGPVETPPDGPRVSYAQNMEDILIARVFGDRKGAYVDIGANHPYIDSNTYFFYLRGWRGVNIEPAPSCQALFREQRPGDLNLGVAVSDVEGELPFFEVRRAEELTGLSTLSAEVAEAHRAAGFEVVETRVPVRTMANLVKEHGIEPPDVLSIDVEGNEAAVIRSVPWETWRPALLVIESTSPGTEAASHLAWEPILLEHGYLFAAFNGLNRFYLREDLRAGLRRFETPVNVFDIYERQDLAAMRAKADSLEECQRHEREARSVEFAHHEQIREAWEWGRVQAQYLQAVWQQDRDSFAQQRVSWAEALAFFEQSQAHFREQEAAWNAERSAWNQEREAWNAERAAWKAEHAAWEAEHAAWGAERARFETERANWDLGKARHEHELSEAQRALRPYRLIDRFGVVRAGYGLARRVKKRLVS